MKRLRVFALVVFAVAGIANAELLTNGGLEINVDGDAAYPDGWGAWQSLWEGWSGSYNLYHVNDGVAHSGSNSFEVGAGTAPGAGGYSLLIQDVPGLEGNVDYTLSGYGLDLSPDDAFQGAELKLEFYDTSNALLGTFAQLVPLATDGTWTFASITATSPSGTTWGKAIFDATGPWAGEAGTAQIAWDDTSLVPEPATLALLNLGALLLRKRR